MPDTRKSRDYDVAVIGGGLVGASLACALSQVDLTTAVLEKVPAREASQPSYDDRTLALSASSCNILKALGLWPLLEPNATSIRQIQVSEMKGPGQVKLDPAEMDLEQFGYVVEAREFGAAVMQRLPQLENVDFICPAAVSGLDIQADSTRVVFEVDGKPEFLNAKLVVGADGAQSVIRRFLDIGTSEHDYGTSAVICNFTPSRSHEGRAFECFTSSGPLAVLPHVEGRCGLVWCIENDQVDDLLVMEDSQFLRQAEDRFTRAFGNVLGGFTRLGKRSAYPLRLVKATKDTGPRAVVMGNAAHAIHPIGAQGFNLGLRGVAVLAEVLSEAVQQERDIGSDAVLSRYSEWRIPDQSETVAWSDGLARLFANPTGMAAAARTVGMMAHMIFPSLRRRMAVKAMGFRGRIPLLARGRALQVRKS
jgi:2-octaprenyl-6-methoxyphenol hydroxylase